LTISAVVLYAVFLTVVAALVRPLGSYMARVFSGERTLLDPVLVPVERAMHAVAGVDPQRSMPWGEYAMCFVRFTALLAILIYAVLRLQEHLPWFDEEHMVTPMTRGLAANTAVSFSTTSTWQAYGGESTMSYFSQLAALTTGSFLAAAAGLAVGIAFIRGLAREKATGLGNFWSDVVRATLWVLLPIALLLAALLVWQRVPANLNDYTVVSTVEGGEQVVAQGPVAVLEPIKNLGTNGGGFFNVNGAHPLANPSALTNFAGMLAIAVLPAALTYTFGRMAGRQREGWMLFGVMAFLFSAGLLISVLAEQNGNPLVSEAAAVEADAGGDQPGGNMEGKETRFGVSGSVLTSIATSNGGTGSFNSMHDSYTSIGNSVPLVNMLLGEIIFGGLGSGLYGMIIMVLLTVFLVGLTVGRTPEYLGKRLDPDEIKRVALYVVAFPTVILVLTGIAVVMDEGKAGLTVNGGTHGFTQIVFAYTSSAANNGLTMASLNANSDFYNLTTAVAMLVGRVVLAVLALSIAGLFVQQGRRPRSLGTVPTATVSFAGVLVGAILIIGGLSYFAILVLGPIAERVMEGT
jgi:K+-transporting ATPase ATPase A chain